MIVNNSKEIKQIVEHQSGKEVIRIVDYESGKVVYDKLAEQEDEGQSE